MQPGNTEEVGGSRGERGGVGNGGEQMENPFPSTVQQPLIWGGSVTVALWVTARVLVPELEVAPVCVAVLVLACTSPFRFAFVTVEFASVCFSAFLPLLVRMVAFARELFVAPLLAAALDRKAS